jgi:hypothetical protein
MKTQEEIIKAAKRAYIVHLSRANSGMCDRFAIYYEGEDRELDVLWPHDSDKGKSASLLPFQVYSKRENLPAYHFRVGGCGFDKCHALATKTLRAINPAIEVLKLGSGWSPSRVSV